MDQLPAPETELGKIFGFHSAEEYVAAAVYNSQGACRAACWACSEYEQRHDNDNGRGVTEPFAVLADCCCCRQGADLAQNDAEVRGWCCDRQGPCGVLKSALRLL
jgi:hypothetical protein